MKLRRFVVVAVLALLAVLGAARAADGRDEVAYLAWRAEPVNAVAAQAFLLRLGREGLADVLPPHLLLRNARDWQRCGAEPFSVPPVEHLPKLMRTLRLLQVLRERGLLPHGEPVSVYRSPDLNRCAGGAPQSAHVQASAIDFEASGSDAQIAPGLCRFWREQGRRWDMGLSVYRISGNIHVDTNGYRNWGSFAQGASCGRR